MKTLTTYRGPAETLPALTTWNYAATSGFLTSKLDATNVGPTYTYTLVCRL